MRARPVGQTVQSTVPYCVARLPCFMEPATAWTAIAWAAGFGSSLAAVRPGRYRDGAEDATTLPLASIATAAVTAWVLSIRPVIAGTASVPSGDNRARPGSAGTPGSPSTFPAGTPPG